jgi:hypothetical protein
VCVRCARNTIISPKLQSRNSVTKPTGLTAGKVPNAKTTLRGIRTLTPDGDIQCSSPYESTQNGLPNRTRAPLRRGAVAGRGVPKWNWTELTADLTLPKSSDDTT